MLQNGGQEGWDEKRRDSQAVCVLGVCGMLGDAQRGVPEGQPGAVRTELCAVGVPRRGGA